jgi:FkbM family methyltransferase
MNRAKRIIRLISKYPQLFLKASVKSILPKPKGNFVHKVDGKISIPLNFEYDRAMKMMYLGLYEFELIAAVKKLLNEGDTFIDVGANIGYLTSAALSRVSKKGEVHSFEPVPEYFNRLEEVKHLNPNYNLILNQYALGESESKSMIDVSDVSNIGWNTIVPGMMEASTRKQSIEISVKRLDDYIEQKKLKNISLIKIDTEGYEFPVLKGLKKYFDQGNRPTIICEIAPAAYPLLDVSLEDLNNYMKQYGYSTFLIDDTSRQTDITTLTHTENILFIQ